MSGNYSNSRNCSTDKPASRDTAHGECIDGIVPRDGNDAQTIAHDNMLPLTRDMKAGFLESAHGVKVIDTWDARQG
jgi:hypothetical protein